jgi:hypothetical protein
VALAFFLGVLPVFFVAVCVVIALKELVTAISG